MGHVVVPVGPVKFRKTGRSESEEDPFKVKTGEIGIGWQDRPGWRDRGRDERRNTRERAEARPGSPLAPLGEPNTGPGPLRGRHRVRCRIMGHCTFSAVRMPPPLSYKRRSPRRVIL